MTSKWETVKLGDLCKLTKGSSPTLKTVPGPYPLVVTGGERKSSDSYQFDGEAVCVPMVSSTGHGHASLKRVHYESGKFAVANIIVAAEVLDPEVCNTKYLFHYLQCFKDELIVPLMKGTANVSLSQKSLATVPVAIPPLAEQRRIVDLIGALDDAIEAAEESAGNAESLWWEMTRVLEEETFATEKVPLSSIANIGGGLAKNKKEADLPGAVEVPYLRVANVHRRFIDLSEVATVWTSQAKAERTTLQTGDILMNEGGDKDKLGRGAVWYGQIDNCIHQNHVFRVRIDTNRFSPEFVSAWSNSFGQKWFELHGTQTTGIASISKTTLSKFPLPALPLQEQEDWAELLGSIQESEGFARRHAQSLRDLRTELLTALLSGAHEIPESYDSVMELADA